MFGEVPGIPTKLESGKMCFWGNKRGTTRTHHQQGGNCSGFEQGEINLASTNTNKREGFELVLGANPVAQLDTPVVTRFRYSIACSST